ncbi:hypothetical protein ACFL54_07390 [Planctomycetota bacterium]
MLNLEFGIFSYAKEVFVCNIPDVVNNALFLGFEAACRGGTGGIDARVCYFHSDE